MTGVTTGIGDLHRYLRGGCFEEAFEPANVKVEAFGNVLSAASFLYGLAAEELTPEELEYAEPGYEVTIGVRAMKSGGSA